MDTTPAGSKGASKCPYSGAEINLETVTVADPDVIVRPQAAFQALRERDPVHFDPKLEMWLVTRYEDLQKVLADPYTFSVKHGYAEQQAKGFKEEYQKIIDEEGGGYVHDSIGIMTDPPDHTRIRRLMEKAFTAHRMKTLEPGTAKKINEVIDIVGPKGRCEAMKEIAGPFTIRVITEQLGLTDYDTGKIQHWSECTVAQIARMQNREEMVKNAKAVAEMQKSLIGHLEAREAEPREDMLSDLVHATLEDGTKLNREERISLARALLIGGNHTTTTAMGNLIFTLASRPDIAKILDEVAEDDRKLSRFVEELLRFEPPVTGLSRMTTREVELGGKTLPKDAHMLLLYPSGNYDEKEFACPWEFDIDRPNLGRHIAFGAGVHRCVGIALARMEVKVAAREIARRLKNIRLTVPVESIRCLPSIASRTYHSLPISFDLK